MKCKAGRLAFKISWMLLGCVSGTFQQPAKLTFDRLKIALRFGVLHFFRPHVDLLWCHPWFSFKGKPVAVVCELLTALAGQSTDAWCVVQNSPFEVMVCSVVLQKQLQGLNAGLDTAPEETAVLLKSEVQTICAQVTSQFQSGDCLLLDTPVGPFNQARITTLQLSAETRGFLLFFLERTEVSPVDEIASRIDGLSRRQTEILIGLYGGETNKSMSIRMGISEKTVEKHRAKVMENMRARTAAELIRMITIAQMSGAVTQLAADLPGLDCPAKG